MEDSFFDMAADSPYPFFLGHTVGPTLKYITHSKKVAYYIC